MAKSKKKLADVTKASQNKALQYEIKWIDWIIWGIYAAIIFYVTAHHEPWRDEAQSWLIARDNSIGSLFAYLPNEGHPPLWYLLLMPFSKLGLPYFTANIIHNVIAVSFAWLLLFKIRLPRWLSASILFSYFFLYEYAVIARNYSMVALLLAFAGTLYPKRFEKPFWYALVIFLLFQTNILAFCVGAGLGLLFLWDMIELKNFKWKNFAALGVMAAGGLAMIILLLSAGLKSSYSREAEDKVAAFIETFGNAMLVDKESGGFAVFNLYSLSFVLFPD
ncbi:MAG: hypothetical protein RMJ53_09155 [Chitinophagales bacterium]|nr:hypothetical protein [Chitinophagales bacterium]